MKVGYMFVGKRSCPRRTQQKVMDDEGIARAHVYVDQHPHRDARDEMLTPGLIDRSGGIVVIAAEPVIASMGRERRKVLRRLRDLGVRIQVAHGEPRLYETDDEIEEFIRAAVQVSRKSNGRAMPKAPGRPSNFSNVSPEDMAEIRRRWHSPEFKISEVVAAAIDRGASDKLNRGNMNYVFGPRWKPREDS